MFNKLFRTKKTERIHIINLIIKILSHYDFNDIRALDSKLPAPHRVLKPRSGESYTPDLSAKKGDQIKIFSIEDSSTIKDAKTHEKWTLFAAFEKQNNASFFIVVNTIQLIEDINIILSELSITAQVWNISEVKGVDVKALKI